MRVRGILLVFLLFSFAEHTANAKFDLGTQRRFYSLVHMANSCPGLLTNSMTATQLGFARDFLKYDANDIETGLVNALIAHFPRSEVLFSGTPEKLESTNTASLSYRLRKEGHREADRTFTSLILLQRILILSSELEEFATPISFLNPGEPEITRIRRIVYDYLTDIPGIPLDKQVYSQVKIEKLHALIVRLIIHDQGKFDRFIKEYKRRLMDDGIDPSTLSADHDRVLSDIQARYPTAMLPNLDALLPTPREHLIQSDIGALNPGRFFQYEAPARHILALGSLEGQPFQLSLIKEIFDVGGAKASEHPEGSFWIKPVIASYFKLYDDYMAGQIGGHPRQIARYYWNRARSKGQELGMATETREDLALVKLAPLFRLDQFPKPAQKRRIEALIRAVDRLDVSVKARLFEELTKDGIDDGWALTFGYMPETSEVIQKDLGTWFSKDVADEGISDENIDRALDASLEILFRAVQLARMSLKERELEGSGEFTLELPGVKDFAKKYGLAALMSAKLVFTPAGSYSGEIVPIPIKDLPNDTKRASVSHLWKGATGIFGEGGGGDAVTAAQILNTAALESGFGTRFTVPVVISVRENKMGSRGTTGQEGATRHLAKPGQQIAPGVQVVLPESEMIGDDGRPVGRFFEAKIAAALKNRGLNTQVVLVEYLRGNVSDLAEKYEAIRKHYDLTTIVGVDTGGDKYGPEKPKKQEKELSHVSATVEQDRETFEAGRIVYHAAKGTLTHLVAVAGVGFDSPSHSPEIYRQGFQTDWNSENGNWNELGPSLLSFWEEIGLTGEAEAVHKKAHYSRTQQGLLRAVQGVRGYTQTALPVASVTNNENPWDPNIYIQPVTAAVLTVDGSALENQ